MLDNRPARRRAFAIARSTIDRRTTGTGGAAFSALWPLLDRAGAPPVTTRGTLAQRVGAPTGLRYPASSRVPRLVPQGQAVKAANDPTMPDHRKRLKRKEVPGHARYLTFSCFRRLPLLDNPAIRDAFADQMLLARKRLGFRLLAWVVMPEHVHLMVFPGNPALTVPRILMAIKRPFAARVLARWRELEAPVLDRIRDSSGRERFWQAGGGYDRNVFTEDELHEKVRYVHRNPVRRGLVGQEEEWAWSSARASRKMETRWPKLDRA